MKKRNFHDLIQKKWDERKFVCVGLDTVYEKIPEHVKTDRIGQSLFLFNKAIIDATIELVCAYKINSAFYEAYGTEGIEALEGTIEYIVRDCKEHGVPAILDAKRADIGNTNEGYVKFAFDQMQADAITVSPYLGSEAMKPFLDKKEKGIIVLCRTSNEGAGEELQDLYLQTNRGSIRVFEQIARNVHDKWNYNDNCLLVVGATAPEQLQAVRKIVPTMPILVPGVGKQGGDLKAVLTNGLIAKKTGLIINSSRDVIYASNGEDFAEVAREVVHVMNFDIHAYME
jgi:orotidine-5'-phosphate decarboxylase